MTSVEALRLLNLKDNYTEKQLKENYRKAIRKVHPDLNPNLPNAKEKAQRLNEAHELLKELLNNKSETKKVNYTYESNSKDYNKINFQKYKNQILMNLQEILNHIFINDLYEDDEDILYYAMSTKDMYDFYVKSKNIILKCNNKFEIDDMRNQIYETSQKYLYDFVYHMFSKFYNYYRYYINDEWLKNKCEFFINTWASYKKDFEDNHINTAMRFVYKGKKEIATLLIKNEIELALSKLPNNSKNYLDFSFIKDKLPNMFFDKYDIKTIMMHPELVSDFLKAFNEEEKRKYQTFLKEKNKKISELLKLINKNNFELNNQKIKELQLEMDKTEFNKKYNVFKEEIDELLRHKRSVEKKIEKIKYLYDLLKFHKLDFDKEKLNELNLNIESNNFYTKYSLIKSEIENLIIYKERAIRKSKLDNCFNYLNEMYGKSKKNLIHRNNFNLALHYLSMIIEEKLDISNIDLLNKIKFRNVKKDSLILNKLKQIILIMNSNKNIHEKKLIKKI